MLDTSFTWIDAINVLALFALFGFMAAKRQLDKENGK